MVTIKVTNRRCAIQGALSRSMLKILDDRLSYYEEGYQHTKVFQLHKWDGKRHLFIKKRQSFPVGLLEYVTEILEDNQIQYELDDRRDPAISNTPLEWNKKIVPRDYQRFAIKKIVDKRTGIIKVATGGGKCVVDKTLIKTSEGRRYIEEIVRDRLKLNVNSGVDEKEYPIEQYHDNGIKETYELSTKRGYREVVTKQHKFLSIDVNNEIVFKELKDIRDGDYVALEIGKGKWSSKYFKDNEFWNEDAARFTSLLIAEGSTTGSIRFYNNDKKLILEFIRLCNKFGQKYEYKEEKNVVQIKSSNSLFALLDDFQIERNISRYKKFPDWILYSPRKVVKEFLKYYFEYEGNVNKDHLEITSASFDIVNKIQLCLLDFGIISSVNSYLKCATNGTQIKKEYWTLRISGKNITRFKAIIGFISNRRLDKYAKFKTERRGEKVPQLNCIVRKLWRECKISSYINKKIGIDRWRGEEDSVSYERLDKILEAYKDYSDNENYKLLKAYREKEYLWEEVDWIEPRGLRRVYDIGISEQHSYVAEGFVNHNSFIGAGLVAYLNVPTLLCVTTIDLLHQMVNDLSECMPDVPFGMVGGGECDIQDITVMTMQSAVKALGEKYEIGDYDDVKDDTGIKNKAAIADFIENKVKLLVIDECLTGDSLIVGKYGQIVEIKDCKNNEIVVSSKNGKLEDKIISNSFYREAETYMVRDTGGFTTCTLFHKWIVYDSLEERITTKTTEELKVDSDYSLYPKFIPFKQTEKSISAIEAHGIALILCDGHLEKNNNTTKIEVSKDKKYFEDQMRMFGEKVGYKFSSRLTKTGSIVISHCSKEFRNYFKDYCALSGDKTHYIEIPKQILNGSIQAQLAFIDGCFCAEGDISKNSLNFNLTSLKFVRQLQLMLRRFGIDSSFGIYHYKNKTKSVVYRLRITGQNMVKFYNTLGLSMKRKNKALKKEISRKKNHGAKYPITDYVRKVLKDQNLKVSTLVKQRKDFSILWGNKKSKINEEMLDILVRNTQDDLLTELSYYYLKPIKEVVKTGKNELVYDFEVSDNHNFLVNGKLTSNCHHAASSTIQTIARKCKKAVWRTGMSATPWRYRGDDLLIEGTLGKTVIDIRASDLIDRGLLVQPTIQYHYMYNDPRICKGIWQEVYKNCIVRNKERNERIIQEALKMSDEGRPTLVLIDEVEEHGKEIKKRLVSEGARVEFLHGKVAKKKRQKIIQDIKNHKIKILIATTLADEGLNIPCLSGLVLGGGKRSRTKILQRIGRIVRLFENKTDAFVIDFIDDGRYVLDHSLTRIRTLKGEKNFIIKAPTHMPQNLKDKLRRMRGYK